MKIELDNLSVKQRTLIVDLVESAKTSAIDFLKTIDRKNRGLTIPCELASYTAADLATLVENNEAEGIYFVHQYLETLFIVKNNRARKKQFLKFWPPKKIG